MKGTRGGQVTLCGVTVTLNQRQLVPLLRKTHVSGDVAV